MKAEVMKERVKIQLINMGYSNEADELIERYWNEVAYLKSARSKALYMIA